MSGHGKKSVSILSDAASRNSSARNISNRIIPVGTLLQNGSAADGQMYGHQQYGGYQQQATNFQSQKAPQQHNEHTLKLSLIHI